MEYGLSDLYLDDSEDNDDVVIDNNGSEPIETEPESTPDDEPPITDEEPIHTYLKSFNIDPNKIEFEDGEFSSWDEMDKELQHLVLQQLREQQEQNDVDYLTSLATEYNLDADELEYIKSIKGTGNRLVDDFNTPLSPDIVDVDNLTDEDVYKYYLWDLLGEDATDEKLDELLLKAKDDDPQLFQKTIDKTRVRINEMNEYAQQKYEHELKTKQIEILEKEQKFAVEEVNSMTDIFGIPLDNDLKNELLNKIADYNEDGDTQFFLNIASNPKAMAAAQFAIDYMPQILQNIAEEITSREEEAYNRGYEMATKGLAKDPISKNTSTNVKETKTTAPVEQSGKRDPNGIASLFDD